MVSDFTRRDLEPDKRVAVRKVIPAEHGVFRCHDREVMSM